MNIDTSSNLISDMAFYYVTEHFNSLVKYRLLNKKNITLIH